MKQKNIITPDPVLELLKEELVGTKNQIRLLGGAL
jgi:hypothetical protein